MKYQAGTSLGDLERSVIEATDAFKDADRIARTAERDRLEARDRLEKAQQALEEAFSELRSRAPGGRWAAPVIGVRAIGTEAIRRVLTAPVAAE